MFTKDDILARLQDGDSVDQIAEEMANALNEAKTAYAEKEAESKRQEELKAEQRNAIEHIVFELAEYVGKYLPEGEFFTQEIEKLTAEDYDNIADSIEKAIKTIKDLKNFEFNLPKFGFKREEKDKLDEDPIFDFLFNKPWLS